MGCEAALVELQGLPVKGALDIKAGYLNVPLDLAVQRYAGLITQDGLYIFCRMAFGFNLAPGHFQQIMNLVLDQGRPLRQGTYLDDCSMGGLCEQSCWRDTREAALHLLSAGLPLNAGKLALQQRQLPVLGRVISGNRYALGPKALAKILGISLPQTFCDL